MAGMFAGIIVLITNPIDAAIFTNLSRTDGSRFLRKGSSHHRQ